VAEPIVIRLHDVWFNPCDYQPEGFTCAMAGWAAQEFGFVAPVVPITFDQLKKRYVFEFPEAELRVATPAAAQP